MIQSKVNNFFVFCNKGSFVFHTNFDQVTKMHDFFHWAQGVNIAVL